MANFHNYDDWQYVRLERVIEDDGLVTDTYKDFVFIKIDNVVVVYEQDANRTTSIPVFSIYEDLEDYEGEELIEKIFKRIFNKNVVEFEYQILEPFKNDYYGVMIYS